MKTTQLHKFMNHRYRRWFVAGVSLAIVVVGGLPVVDDMRSSYQQRLESQQAIQTVSLQAENLPQLREQAARRLELVSQQSGIGQNQLSLYRDECLKLIRKHHCRAENVGEGRPLRQPWNENLQPLVASTTVVKEKPKYEVITNSLNLTIVGELRHLVSLISDLQSLHDCFVPAKLTIEQHSVENELKLSVDMAMVELVKSTSAK